MLGIEYICGAYACYQMLIRFFNNLSHAFGFWSFFNMIMFVTFFLSFFKLMLNVAEYYQLFICG